MQMTTPQPNDLLPGERCWPIYQMQATYVRDDTGADLQVFTHSFMLGPDEPHNLDQATDRMIQICEKHLDHTIDHGPCQGITNLEANMQYLKTDVSLKRFDTFLLTWFSHYTFNIHLTDLALKQAFQKYLGRVERFNRMNGHFGHDINPSWHDKPFIPVMGANDYWRIKGPCRCSECERLGLTRFDH